LLLQGLDARRQGDSAGLTAATEFLRQALLVFPEYPEAMVALADVIRERATKGDLTREQGFSEALSLATRATELDPNNANAWLQIADVQHRHFWDFDRAETSYQKALALNPNNASIQASYSRFLSKSGRYEDAVLAARAAYELDPLSVRSASTLVIRLIRAKRLTESRLYLDQLKQLHSDNADLPWLEANWHIRNETYSDALQWIALEELAYLRLSLGAIALHHLGRTGQAQNALQELITTDADGAAFQIAEVYAQWQQPDDAFDWLQRAFEQGDPGLSELYSSVNLDSLHADPRFRTLAEKIGLPTEKSI